VGLNLACLIKHLSPRFYVIVPPPNWSAACGLDPSSVREREREGWMDGKEGAGGEGRVGLLHTWPFKSK